MTILLTIWAIASIGMGFLLLTGSYREVGLEWWDIPAAAVLGIVIPVPLIILLMGCVVILVLRIIKGKKP